MKNWYGFLIKYYRLKLNYSQSGICKGICTVSYLSKIENGTTQASEEIIEQLFKVLGITTCFDDHILNAGRDLLYTYFDKVAHEEDTAVCAEKIKALMTKAEISPLYFGFKLFEIQEALVQKDIHTMQAQLIQLKAFTDYMDDKLLFIYELLYGKAFSEEAENAFLKADRLYPCSISKAKIATLYYEKGQFQKALQYCRKAYDLAAYEGNVSVMSQVCIIEGGCYCNLHQFDLMMNTYERCLNLCRNDEKMRYDISYNIGAVYLENGCYEQAYDYLKRAEAGRSDALDQLLTYHKLSLALYYLKRKTESLSYIEKAEKLLEAGMIQNHYEDIYSKMMQIVRMMIEDKMNDEYLKLLKDVYDECEDRLIYGFQQFHGQMLIEAYKTQRRYKEALHLSLQMQDVLKDL